MLVYNTINVSQISLDGRFVVDPQGNLAITESPNSNLADYIFRDCDGNYLIGRPDGPRAAPISPQLGALIMTDPRDGAAFLPLGLLSPLFRQPPREGAPRFTFRYYTTPVSSSPDGRVLIDPEGNLLWRSGAACIAGQIFAEYDRTGVPVGFSYSVSGGRLPLDQAKSDAMTANYISSALVMLYGALSTQWWNEPALDKKPVKRCPISAPTSTQGEVIDDK